MRLTIKITTKETLQREVLLDYYKIYCLLNLILILLVVILNKYLLLFIKLLVIRVNYYRKEKKDRKTDHNESIYIMLNNN